MNQSRVVKVEADATGVRLRLWTDDLEGRHLAVSEIEVSEEILVHWARAIAHEQNRAASHQETFDY